LPQPPEAYYQEAGRAILGAFRGATGGAAGASARVAGRESGQSRLPGDADVTQGGPRRRALDRWRDGVAFELGVPRYVVLRHAAVAALSTCDMRDGRALAALPGLGPRALAKQGEALLRLIAAHPPDHYLLPMDQDAGR